MFRHQTTIKWQRNVTQISPVSLLQVISLWSASWLQISSSVTNSPGQCWSTSSPGILKHSQGSHGLSFRSPLPDRDMKRQEMVLKVEFPNTPKSLSDTASTNQEKHKKHFPQEAWREEETALILGWCWLQVNLHDLKDRDKKVKKLFPRNITSTFTRAK